jgi:hypothetical protein
MRGEQALTLHPLAELSLPSKPDSFWRDVNGGSPLEAPVREAPAYVLIDNAGGRFAIDGATGMITLANPERGEAELGCVHPVRIRIHDPLIGDYEALFHLRIDALLPTPVLADGTDPLAPFEVPSDS